MSDPPPDRSKFLISAAMGYSLVTFAIILGSIPAPMGVLSLPLGAFLILLPLLAIIAMVVARLYVRFHWAVMVIFVCWILATVSIQFRIFEQAAWSV